MKRIALVIFFLIIFAASACSSALSHGDRSTDDRHAFVMISSQMIANIGTDTAPEGKAYLVIKYEIENRQSNNDTAQRWVDRMILEARGEYYHPVFIDSLDNQLWETSLSGHEKKLGYMSFVVPQDIFDFSLSFTFPVSGNEIGYELHAVDKRINVNVDWVLNRLRTIENNKRIPLIGEPLALSTPIRYQGVILVPREDLTQLLEQTRDLPEDNKRVVIEEYLLAQGHGRLE